MAALAVEMLAAVDAPGVVKRPLPLECAPQAEGQTQSLPEPSENPLEHWAGGFRPDRGPMETEETQVDHVSCPKVELLSPGGVASYVGTAAASASASGAGGRASALGGHFQRGSGRRPDLFEHVTMVIFGHIMLNELECSVRASRR